MTRKHGPHVDESKDSHTGEHDQNKVASLTEQSAAAIRAGTLYVEPIHQTPEVTYKGRSGVFKTFFASGE